MVKIKLSFILIAVFFIGCQKTKKIEIDLNYSPKLLELFGEGNISTSLYERDIAISAEGDEIIYTLGDFNRKIRALVIIKKGHNGWGEKQILSFSGEFMDVEPFYSLDGKQLFFASDRPMEGEQEKGDFNIWVSRKTDFNWSDPEPLDTIINSENNEFYPAVSENGNLYITTKRKNGIGKEDIFLCKFVNGVYQKPVVLDTNINSALFEFNAYISPKEDLLIFSSFGRKDGLGGGDLYYSKKDEEGNWSKAENMGATINSDKLDYCPFIDYSRDNFYFTSEKTNQLDGRIETVIELNNTANTILNGMGNIYRINMDKVMLK